jgi:hypothetical protein
VNRRGGGGVVIKAREHLDATEVTGSNAMSIPWLLRTTILAIALMKKPQLCMQLSAAGGSLIENQIASATAA